MHVSGYISKINYASAANKTLVLFITARHTWDLRLGNCV